MAQCKVGVITGAAMGIGLACAEQLLKAGARAVVMGDVLEKEGELAACKLAKTYGKEKVTFKKCDVLKREDFCALVKTAREKYGGMHILVNNAGILNDLTWERMVAININATVFGTLLGFHDMGKHNGGQGGTVVNLASILGLQGFAGCPCYTGTKHFVVSFTRSVGVDFFEKLTGVKVAAICPGVTITPLITKADGKAWKGFQGLNNVLVDGLKKLPPQETNKVGECLVKLLTENKNGSLYVTEANECYRVEIPDKKQMKAKDEKNACAAKK